MVDVFDRHEVRFDPRLAGCSRFVRYSDFANLAAENERLKQRIADYQRDTSTVDAHETVNVSDKPEGQPEPVVDTEPWGYWVKHKYAEGGLVRTPCFIPEESHYTEVLPLYTSPPTSELEALRKRVAELEGAALSSAAVADRDPVANKPVSDHWPEAHEVADILSENKGFWRSCSGCHETNEGHPTGPWSMILGCNLGNGCHECGGIGAVWDTTDYADMGDYLAKNIEREPRGWICEGCSRFSADPEEDLKRLRLGGHLSCCPERKISPLYLDPPPTSELEAENARLRDRVAELEKALPFVVQYRRADDGVRWADMAAFDVEGAAERYCQACAEDTSFWEYRTARRVREGGKVDVL